MRMNPTCINLQMQLLKMNPIKGNQYLQVIKHNLTKSLMTNRHKRSRVSCNRNIQGLTDNPPDKRSKKLLMKELTNQRSLGNVKMIYFICQTYSAINPQRSTIMMPPKSYQTIYTKGHCTSIWTKMIGKDVTQFLILTA